MKKKKQAEMQTMARSYRESLNHIFFRHPFDLEKIDIAAVRSLSKELVQCLEKYRVLEAEIKNLEG